MLLTLVPSWSVMEEPLGCSDHLVFAFRLFYCLAFSELLYSFWYFGHLMVAWSWPFSLLLSFVSGFPASVGILQRQFFSVHEILVCFWVSESMPSLEDPWVCEASPYFEIFYFSGIFCPPFHSVFWYRFLEISWVLFLFVFLQFIWFD